MSTQNKAYYETQSLPLSIAIASCGILLESVVKDSSNKATFVFTQSPELTKIIELFWRKALKIEPNLFWETQRFLKNRIYAEEVNSSG